MDAQIGAESWDSLPPVLTVGRISKLLGIPEQEVFARLRDGAIIFYQIGVHRIVFRDELRAHIEGRSPAYDLLAGLSDPVTSDEIERLFGYRRGLITDWFRRGVLPGRKPGQSWEVPKDELCEFFDRVSNRRPEPSRAIIPGSDEEALIMAAVELMNPARINIIRAISPIENGAYYSDIVESSGVPTGSIRYHLMALEEIGVLTGDIPVDKRHGRAVRYSVDIARLGQILGQTFTYILS